MEELTETPLEEFADAVVPWTAVVLIVVTEGRRVLARRSTMREALESAGARGGKAAAASAVGAFLIAVDLGVVSIPAAFLTRIGLDRFRFYPSALATVDAHTSWIGTLRRQ